MNIVSNIIAGDTYPWSASYDEIDGTWTPVISIVDPRTSTKIDADVSFAYDLDTNTYSGLFTPDTTSTLTVGPVTLNVRFTRAYTPPRAYEEVVTVDRFVINCDVLDAPVVNRDEILYFTERLADIRDQIEKRVKAGVEEYEIFDRRTRYIDIDKLHKLEQYYASKVAKLELLKNMDQMPRQISFE